jgi:hypothetical protein
MKYGYMLGKFFGPGPRFWPEGVFGSDEMGEDKAAVLSGAGFPEMRRSSAMRPGLPAGGTAITAGDFGYGKTKVKSAHSARFCSAEATA